MQSFGPFPMQYTTFSGGFLMAHNLKNNQMAWVDEAPWHGLGKNVPPTVTAREMCSAAGLEWAVRKEPAPGARKVTQSQEFSYHDCTTYDRYLILRDKIGDENEPVALGMVGSGYEPLQNTEAFTFFEPFIEFGYAQFHTAGALGNGERVWVLAKLTNSIVIEKDDVVDRYLLLSNSHDGSGAVTIRFTPIRVVCQNTLNFAMKESRGVVSIRHTRYVSRNLAKAQAEQLRRVIDKAYAEAESLFHAMRSMEIKKDKDDQKRNEYLERIFPKTEGQKKNDEEPERWKRVKHIIDDDKFTPRATKNTLWALYNAVVRDEDFRISREAAEDARLSRVWFGSGHDLKIKALDAARQYVQSAT